MKKIFNQSTRLLLLAALFFSIALPMQAQLNMTRSLFTGTYSPISTLGGALTSTATGDDGVQTLVPIGFSFNYLGTNYTTVDMCTNGWISFAAGGANSWTNSNLFTTTTPNLTLAPWWDDLNSGTGAILYQTQGVPGSQTFTVQWTDVASYNGSLKTLNFQVILYEGTNVIEFRYGTLGTGTFSTSESASIGIEGTGGAGNFIDGVSGSSFINNSYMTTFKWPAAFLRFTPGAPTPLPGGTYTVGLSGVFPNLSEAVANINHRGMLGPITLSLVDANYDTTMLGGLNLFPIMLGPVTGNSSVNTITIQPASGTSTLTSRGSYSGGGGNQASATAFGTATEPILAIVGTDYVTVRNLNLVATGTQTNNLLDRGIYVANATATNGSTDCLFENISISLRRTNNSSIGIQQNTITTPTSVAGANSNNIYRNLTITDVYAGIYLLGNGSFPDLGCQIGTTSPTSFNTIGGTTPFDIGSGTLTTQTYGIRIGNQSGAKVFNNQVRNVSASGVTDGILCELSQGTTEIYMNKVFSVRNNGTTSTSNACGIRANSATTAGHALRVYNNFVSDVTSAFTGAATATRIIKGIFVQSAGGGLTTSSISVDANNVRIDGSSSPNASNACYEIGTASGVVINTRNNVFANFTGAQAGVSNHTTWYSTSASSIGNTGSASNYNDLYVATATNGPVGIGGGTQYATLANWQTAMVGQDVNSVSVDPSFLSPTDLHTTGIGINNIGNLTAAPWVTVDIDNAARSVTPDIGADEFTPSTIDMQALALAAPVTGGCYSANEPVSITIRNNAPVTIDFAINPTTVTANITGSATATLTVVLNSGTLAAGATQAVAMGTINMSAAGSYTFNAFTSVAGDGVGANDAMAPVTINYQPGIAAAARTSLCDGDSSTVSVTGNTSSTLQWQFSTDGGTTWSNVAGATGVSFMAIPSDTTVYRAQMCGSLVSTTTTINVSPVVSPTTMGDTVCGADTLHLMASGPGVLNWYTVPSGGTAFYSGASLDTVLNSTTTYYVSNVSGGGLASVGLATNVGGGGQQASTNYNIFDVFAPATLVGAYVYPGAAGNVVCELRDNLGNLITTRTIAVGPSDVNNRTYVALNIPLTPGTGYRLAQGAGSVSMFRNSAGVTMPYTLPGVLSIYNTAAGTGFWYWFYEWQVLTGCEGPRVAVTGVVNPPVAITAAAASSTICEHDSTSLSVTSANAGYSYSWTPSGSLSASTGSTVTAFPVTTTDYIVNAIDSLGCRTADTVEVMVNLVPNVNFVVDSTVICIGDSSSLNAQVGASFYENLNDVPILDLQTTSSTITVSGLSPVMTANGPGSLVQVCFDVTHTWDSDINFTLISPQGLTYDLCSGNGGSGDNFTGTCFNMSATTNITAGTAPFTGSFIPEGPGGFATFAGQNPNGVWTLEMYDAFSGDQGTLLNWSIEFDAVSPSYAWTSNPPGFTSTSGNIVVTPAVSTTYFLTVTDTVTGCDTVYEHTVNVNPALSATINGPSVACFGSTVDLTSTVTGGNGFFFYDWDGLGTNDSLSVVITSDTMFVLNVMDSCSTPMATDTLHILVAVPVSLTTSGGATICEGDTATLTATATGGDGNYSYVWSNALGTSATVTVTPTTTTTYTVTVTEGCSTTASGSATVTVTPTVTAGFSFTGASLSYSFTNTSANATSYVWDFGDGNTSTLQNPTHTYAVDGNYTVCVTAINSCDSVNSCQTLTVVSTSQSFGNGTVQLWPNPARDAFNVRVEGLTGTELKMELYNVTGQRVYEKQLIDVNTTVNERIETTVPAGVYYLRVNDGINSATLRVVMQ